MSLDEHGCYQHPFHHKPYFQKMQVYRTLSRSGIRVTNYVILNENQCPICKGNQNSRITLTKSIQNLGGFTKQDISLTLATCLCFLIFNDSKLDLLQLQLDKQNQEKMLVIQHQFSKENLSFRFFELVPLKLYLGSGEGRTSKKILFKKDDNKRQM